MSIWQNPLDGSLHDDMDGAALSLPSWPQGMTLYKGVYPPPAPAPTQAQIIASFESAVQNWLDTTAQSWQYESILSASSYANSTVAKFKAEATALIAWRDAVWQACYAELAAVQAGAPMPATPDAFIATLPQAPVRPA